MNRHLPNLTNKLPLLGAAAFAHGNGLGNGLPYAQPAQPARRYQWICGFAGKDRPGEGEA